MIADKIRITITTVVEYEFDPTHYDGCKTLEEMARVDLAAAEDDPFLFETMEDAKTDIKAQILRARHRTLLDAGYAPGFYMGPCPSCGRDFTADKRSLVCKPCAEKVIAADPVAYDVLDVEVPHG